ncbi:MAG TPA: hypothetical protein DCY40_06490 [Actinobacteria bacterium]|nr:hypothetical protein [Actinomycetota bacterium]
MNPGAPAGSRRVLACLVALALSSTVLVGRAVAAGAVTRSDLAAAEAAVEEAEQSLAEVRHDLAAAEDSRARMVSTLERLEQRRREESATAANRQSALKARIATMYMAAGGRVMSVVVEDVTTFSTRVAYLAAVTESDQSSLNRFELSAGEIDTLRASAEQQRLADEARIADLVALETERIAALEAARDQLTAVRTAWNTQEAARIAAEEAELRRQEAELAAQLSTTTSTTVVGTTTTTTRPDYGYDPRRGAEQWRSVVTDVFADWGLDQTKCATRNGVEFCVSGQVDNAIRVMSCESSGVPYAENRRSGAAGLFQNLPYYWQSRVNRVRAYHADKSNIPADASIWDPRWNTTIAALLVWESREVLLGNRGGGAVSPAVWPEFNWDRYETSGYGYTAWGKGPNPWGHWTCGARVGVYDSSWVHPWATQQTPPPSE